MALPETREIALSAAEALAVLTGLGHYLDLTEPERAVVEKLTALYRDNPLVGEIGKRLLERLETGADMPR
jgi:hypothetical protein